MNRSTLTLLVMLLFTLTGAAGAQDRVDASTLESKVLFGYQGWFRTPGDGSRVGWSHWSRGIPSAATMTIDLYPDLREFDPKDLCPIPDEAIGARPAYLFSSFKLADSGRGWRRPAQRLVPSPGPRDYPRLPSKRAAGTCAACSLGQVNGQQDTSTHVPTVLGAVGSPKGVWR